MDLKSWDDVASSERFQGLPESDQVKVKSKWEGQFGTSNDLDGVMDKRVGKEPVQEVQTAPLSKREKAEVDFNIRNKSELSRGFSRGVDQAQGMGYGLVGLVGSAVGSDTVRDYGYEGYKKNVREAKFNPTTAKEFTTITSDWKKRGIMNTASDLGDWVASTMGEMGPAAMETMLSATAGAFMGGAATAPAGGVGAVPGFAAGALSKTGIKALLKKAVDFEVKRGIKKGIYKGMTQEAMEGVASRKVGGAMALWMSSAGKEAGQMYMTDAEKRSIEEANPFSAGALGSISGATELLSPLSKIAGQFSGVLTKTAKKLTKEGQEETIGGMVNFLKRAGKEIPKAMGAEGVQEITQEFISSVNEKINGFDAPESWKETAKKYINTFAAGAVGGLAFGAIGSHSSAENIQIVDKEPISPTYVDGKLEYDEEVIQDLRNKIAINTNKSNALKNKDAKDPEVIQQQKELDEQLQELQGDLTNQVEAKKSFDEEAELDLAAFGQNELVNLDKPEIIKAILQGDLTQEQWDRADKSEFTQEEIIEYSDRVQVQSDKDFINEINDTGAVPEPTAEPTVEAQADPTETTEPETTSILEGVDDVSDIDLVSSLQEGVNVQSSESGVYTPSSMVVSEKRSAQDHITDTIAEALGIRIVRFKENNGGAMPINGGFSPTHKDVLFINENSEQSADFVFGHEFTHNLKETDPEAFSTLMEVAKQGMVGESFTKYENKWRDAANREGVGEATDAVEEEMLADFVGDQFSSMEFWENLHKSNPSAFEKILASLKELVSKVLGSKASDDPISKDFYNNITKLQETLSQVTKSYIGEVGATEQLTTKYGGVSTTEGKGDTRRTNIDFGNGASVGIREDENSIYIDSYSIPENEDDFIKPLIALLQYASDNKKSVIAKGQGSNEFFIKRMGFSGSGNNAYFFPLQGKNKGGVAGGVNINHLKPIEGGVPEAQQLPDAEVSMRIDGKVKMMPKFVQTTEKHWKSARTKFRAAKRLHKETGLDADFDRMVELREIKNELKLVHENAIADAHGLTQRGGVANIEELVDTEVDEGFEPDIEERNPVADGLNNLSFLLDAQERAREDAFDSLEEYDEYIEIKRSIREDGFEGVQLESLENRASMMESDNVRERHKTDARNVEMLNTKIDQIEADLTETTGRTPNQLAEDAREEMDKRNQEMEEEAEKADESADFQKFTKGELTIEPVSEGGRAVVSPSTADGAQVPEQAPTPEAKEKPEKAVPEVDGRTEFEVTVDDIIETGNRLKELRDSDSKNDLNKIPSLENRMKLLRGQAERQAPEGMTVNEAITGKLPEIDTTIKPEEMGSQSSSPRVGVKEDSQSRLVSKKSKKDELADLVAEQQKDLNSEITNTLNRPKEETILEEELDALYEELGSTDNAGSEKVITQKIEAIEKKIAEQEIGKNQFKFSRKFKLEGMSPGFTSDFKDRVNQFLKTSPSQMKGKDWISLMGKWAKKGKLTSDVEAMLDLLIDPTDTVSKNELLSVVNDSLSVDIVKDDFSRFNELAIPGGKSYNMTLVKMEGINSIIERFIGINTKFAEEHFGDKGKQSGENLLSHYRSGEHLTDEGEMVNLIYESQSDFVKEMKGIKGRGRYKGAIPFLKSFHLLNFKNALKDAINKGNTHVAWPKSKEQVIAVEGWSEEQVKHPSNKKMMKAIKAIYNESLPNQIRSFVEGLGGKIGDVNIPIKKVVTAFSKRYYVDTFDGDVDISDMTQNQFNDFIKNDLNDFIKSNIDDGIVKLKTSGDSNELNIEVEGKKDSYKFDLLGDSTLHSFGYNIKDENFNAVKITPQMIDLVNKGQIPQFKFSRKENAYGLDVKDPNPEVEKLMEASKLQPESWMSKASTRAKQFVKQSLSPYAELGSGKFGQLKNWLRLLKNSSRQGAYKAWETVYSNVKDLDNAERHVFNRVLVLTDILRDTRLDRDGFSLLDDGFLPFGFERVSDVKNSLRHFQGQARKSPKLMKALAQRRVQLKAVQEELVELGLQPERILLDQNYFHHQVLEHMSREDNFTMFNQQQSVKNKRKSWQKSRKGGIESYNTEYISSEYTMLSQAHEAIHAKRTKMKIKKKYDVFYSVMAEARNEVEGTDNAPVWQDHIPEGYEVFKPDPNMNWSALHTLPEKALAKVLKDEKISMNDLVTGIVKLPDETWIVPSEVAKTLQNLQAPMTPEVEIGSLGRSFINNWKKWTLMNPYRFFRYSTNNMSGDADIVMAYDYKIMKYARQAFADIRSDVKGVGGEAFGIQKGAKDTTPELMEELKQAYEHDVIGSGFVLHEVQDIDSDFKAIMEGPKSGVVNKLTRPFSWWMDNTKAINNIRENVLRLAAFRYFKDRIATGDQNVYGASNAQEILDIKDPIERAAKLSRDLLGDYGNLTETGDWIRNNMIPFYSWMEVNSPRYYWMMKNAKAEGRSNADISKTISWKTAKRVGTTAGKFMALSFMISAWNMTFFGDEEKELSKDQQRRMHLILGRNTDGTIRTIPLSGAFRDVLAWFGGEDIEYDIADVMAGASSPMKKIKEGGAAFVNKWVGGAMPIQKTLAEATLGRTTYPDVFNPRPIHNRADHIFRTFSLEVVSRRMMGLPTRGMGDEFSSRLWYSVDSGESAYFQTRSMVNDFVKENTEGTRPSSIAGTKSNALYYYKQALRFSDMTSAERYLQKYYDLGGNLDGVNISVKLSEPTGGLPKKLKSKFYKSLTFAEKKKLNDASKWYRNTIKKRSRFATQN